MHVQAVQKSVMNSGDPTMRRAEAQRKKQKADQKARKKAQKDEQDALFGEALLAVSKKGSTDKKGGKVEAKGRDADDGGAGEKKGTSRAMKMMFQMDAQEMNDRLREDVSDALLSCLFVWSLHSQRMQQSMNVSRFLISAQPTLRMEPNRCLWYISYYRIEYNQSINQSINQTNKQTIKQTINHITCSQTMFQHWKTRSKWNARIK